MTEEEAKSMGDLFPDLGPEAPVISGIAHDRSEALATVRGVPNEPGMAAKVFTELATAGVNVDMIVQAGASVGTADISFTVPESAVKQVQNTLLDKQEVLGYHSFDVDTNVGKVAVVGVGMKTHAGLAAKFFQALSDFYLRDSYRRARAARSAQRRRQGAAHRIRSRCRSNRSRGVRRYWPLSH